MEELIVVTAAAQEAAEQWIKRAGEAGKKLAVLQPESKLLEKGKEGCEDIQKIFNGLLPTQPPGRLCVHDTHDKRSVCGNFKPDIVISAGQQNPLPSSTVVVVDLKQQGRAYNCAASIHQVRGG